MFTITVYNGTISQLNGTIGAISGNNNAIFDIYNIIWYLVFPFVATLAASIIYSVLKFVFDTLFRRRKNKELAKYFKTLFPVNKVNREFIRNKFLVILELYSSISLGIFISLVIGSFLTLVLFLPYYFIFENLLIYIFRLELNMNGIIYCAFLNFLFLLPLIFYRILSLDNNIVIKEKLCLSEFSKPLLKIGFVIGSIAFCYFYVYNMSYSFYCQYLSNLDLGEDKISIFLGELFKSPSMYETLAIFYIFGIISGFYISYLAYLKLNEFCMELRKFTVRNEMSMLPCLIISTHSHTFKGKIEDINNDLIILNHEGTKKLILWDTIDSLEMEELEEINIENKLENPSENNIKKKISKGLQDWFSILFSRLFLIFLILLYSFLIIHTPSLNLQLFL